MYNTKYMQCVNPQGFWYSMSADSQNHNLYNLLCPNENCKTVILKAGKGLLEHIEKDHVMQIFVNSALIILGDDALPYLQS